DDPLRDPRRERFTLEKIMQSLNLTRVNLRRDGDRVARRYPVRSTTSKQVASATHSPGPKPRSRLIRSRRSSCESTLAGADGLAGTQSRPIGRSVKMAITVSRPAVPVSKNES